MTHDLKITGMPETIAPPTVQAMSPFIRAAGWQLVLTFLSLLMLDGGVFATVFVRTSLAFWLGVLFIIGRRRESLTRTDLIYLKYGSLVAFAVSFPIAEQLIELSGNFRFLMESLKTLRR